MTIRILLLSVLMGLYPVWSNPPKQNPDLKLDAVLKKPWSVISVSTIFFPGCTEPRTTMECEIRKKKDSLSIQYITQQANGKRVKGKKVQITAKQLSEIVSLIRKCYRVAVAEKSFSEELEVLSPKAREAKMKEFERKNGGRPIGGFARLFISVSVVVGDKKHPFGEEFGSFESSDKLSAALKSYETKK